MQQDESENGIAKQEGFNLFHNKKEDKITMSHNPHTKIHFHLHYFGEPVDLFSPQISPPTDLVLHVGHSVSRLKNVAVTSQVEIAPSVDMRSWRLFQKYNCAHLLPAPLVQANNPIFLSMRSVHSSFLIFNT